MKTKAAVLIERNRLEILELEIPKLQPGQVLVELTYSGICGSQLNEIRGLKGEDKWLPHCLGHEGTGRVIEKGSEVTKVAVGDLVVLTWIQSTGIEAGGSTYRSKSLRINSGAVSTFQEVSVVSENRLVRLPEIFDAKTSVLLGCAALTGIGSIKHVLKPRPGSNIVIFGMGGIGLTACLAAKEEGLDEIVCIDTSNHKIKFSKACGATRTINPNEDDLKKTLHQLLPGGADAALDATGNPLVMESLLDFVKPRTGKAVIIGNAKFGSLLKINPNQFNLGKQLLGTWGGNSNPDLDVKQFGEILGKNIALVRQLVSKTYVLEDINMAITEMNSNLAIRPVIKFKQELSL